MLKSHLDMIGRNEPITRKARFWQSYVRALKGTDDMRAPDRVSHRPIGLFRPLSDYAELSTWPHSKSIYDDPIHAVDRISTPGYRYNPVSRETYGYSPRNIYPHHYTPSDRYRPEVATKKYGHAGKPLRRKVPHRIDEGGFRGPGILGANLVELMNQYTSWMTIELMNQGRSWYKRMYDDHNMRMAELGHRYPSRYPLMLRYGPGKNYHKKDDLPTAADIMALARPSVPREKEAAFNYAGQPIYTRGGNTRRPLRELFDPLPSMPMSRITRDPWWYEYPELRPFESPYNYPWITPTPFYLRDSYLSPIKRNYLWDKHPIRPFEDFSEEYTEDFM